MKEVWVLFARNPAKGREEVIGVFSQEKYAKALFDYHNRWAEPHLEKCEIDAHAPTDAPSGKKFVMLPEDYGVPMALVVEDES